MTPEIGTDLWKQLQYCGLESIVEQHFALARLINCRQLQQQISLRHMELREDQRNAERHRAAHWFMGRGR